MGRGPVPASRMSQLVILDNEAVLALADPGHRKHRQVVSQAQVVADPQAPGCCDPAGGTHGSSRGGRLGPDFARRGRFRIAFGLPMSHLMPLRQAPRLGSASGTRVSVADAHIGAVIGSASADQITVVSSDPGDMRLVAGDRYVVMAEIWSDAAGDNAIAW